MHEDKAWPKGYYTSPITCRTSHLLATAFFLKLGEICMRYQSATCTECSKGHCKGLSGERSSLNLMSRSQTELRTCRLLQGTLTPMLQQAYCIALMFSLGCCWTLCPLYCVMLWSLRSWSKIIDCNRKYMSRLVKIFVLLSCGAFIRIC